MNDATPTDNQLEQLRYQCDMLGIKYHHNHKEEKLVELINAHNAKEEEKNTSEKTPSKLDIQTEMRKKANKLVRVMITCNDPSKSNYRGEVFQAGNSTTGVIKKYCPFGNHNGWYMPQILINSIKEKVYRLPASNEGNARSGGMAPAYNITYLDDITPQELEMLKRTQSMRQAQMS